MSPKVLSDFVSELVHEISGRDAKVGLLRLGRIPVSAHEREEVKPLGAGHTHDIGPAEARKQTATMAEEMGVMIAAEPATLPPVPQPVQPDRGFVTDLAHLDFALPGFIFETPGHRD